MTKKISVWNSELINDIDKDFLLEGISPGFSIVPDTTAAKLTETPNYRSALSAFANSFLDQLSAEELAGGKIAEPLIKPVCVHAIGAVSENNNQSSSSN